VNSIIDNLPSRGKTLLEYITNFHAKNKYGPTFGEILNDLGWSTKSLVDYWVQQLEQRGLVERIPRHPRSLKPTPLALGG
jgi:SOS-response transcriptional repressor LexA